MKFLIYLLSAFLLLGCGNIVPMHESPQWKPHFEAMRVYNEAADKLMQDYREGKVRRTEVHRAMIVLLNATPSTYILKEHKLNANYDLMNLSQQVANNSISESIYQAAARRHDANQKQILNQDAEMGRMYQNAVSNSMQQQNEQRQEFQRQLVQQNRDAQKLEQQQIKAPIFCNSYVNGNNVSTTCN